MSRCGLRIPLSQKRISGNPQASDRRWGARPGLNRHLQGHNLMCRATTPRAPYLELPAIVCAAPTISAGLVGTSRLERLKGIEPSSPEWESGTLPLSYSRARQRLTIRPSCSHFGCIALGIEPRSLASGGPNGYCPHVSALSARCSSFELWSQFFQSLSDSFIAYPKDLGYCQLT